jgi:PAS domain-containing protein
MRTREVEIVLMRQLASYLAVPILIVDRHLDLLFFNESAEPILGRRFDETGEIHRGSWNALFRLADENGPIPPEDQLLALAIDREEPSQSRFSLTGLDGIEREVEALAFPLQTRDAGLIGAAGIFWEAKEASPAPTPPVQRELSRSRHAVEVILLRRLTDRLLMPTFVIDAEGHLLFYNPAAEPLIGRPFAEFGPGEMRDWYDPFRPTDVDGSPIKREDHPMIVALRRQQPSHRRFLYQGLDGTRRLVEGTAFPLLGQCNRHLGAVGFFWEPRR